MGCERLSRHDSGHGYRSWWSSRLDARAIPARSEYRIPLPADAWRTSGGTYLHTTHHSSIVRICSPPPSLIKPSKSSDGDDVRPRSVWFSNARMALSWLFPRGCSIRSRAATCTMRLPHVSPSRPSWPCTTCAIASPCSPQRSPLRLVYHHQKEHVRHQSLPPLPAPQAPVPWTSHAVWPQLPTDRRQQCHELLAQLCIDVSHSAPSAACH